MGVEPAAGDPKVVPMVRRRRSRPERRSVVGGKDGPSAGFWAGYRTLLRPKRLGAAGPGRRIPASGRWIPALLGGGAGFALVYFVTLRLLRALREVPEVGAPLASKLLGLGFLLFLGVLLLSNLVAALSSFFLARDLPAALSSPVDWLSLYGARLTETAVSSSWMVLLLLVPLLEAYRTAHGAGAGFWLVAGAVLPPFLVLPAAVGAALTLVLVRIFPARRTRDLLAVTTVAGAALLVAGLRMLRPERLADPEGFRNLVDFLAMLRGPSSPWLPSAWAAEALRGSLEGSLDPFWILLLWSTAAAALVGGAWLHRRLYVRAYSRAQEGAEKGVRSLPLWRALSRALRFVGVRRRELFLKDARAFFRDATQWSQLVILGVLLVVYVYNMRVLPLRSTEAVGAMLVAAVSFLNVGLAGFILAAVAARFVFPAFSLEGPALWLLGSAPVTPTDLVRAKFWAGVCPLLVLGLALVGLTAVGLGVDAGLVLLSLGTVAGLVLAVVAQALAWGIALPRFEAENAAQIPTSLGGFLYMLGALTTLVAVLAVQAWALRDWLASTFPGRAARPPHEGEVLLALGLVALVCGVGAAVPYRLARRGVARTLARARA